FASARAREWGMMKYDVDVAPPAVPRLIGRTCRPRGPGGLVERCWRGCVRPGDTRLDRPAVPTGVQHGHDDGEGRPDRGHGDPVGCQRPVDPRPARTTGAAYR